MSKYEMLITADEFKPLHHIRSVSVVERVRKVVQCTFIAHVAIHGEYKTNLKNTIVCNTSPRELGPVVTVYLSMPPVWTTVRIL